MLNTLHKKILSRGYWQVIIRPSVFEAKRIQNIASLHPIIEKTRVKIRGWDFPHIDYRETHQIDLDWIGQEFEWEHHKSIWRFYQSGQFFQIAALPLDWRDESKLWPADNNWKPGLQLGIGDTIATLTEIHEFAARLALSEAGSDEMQIKIVAGNLRNRFLYVDSQKRWPLFESFQATIEKYPYETTLARGELVANSKDLALEATRELFLRFRWNLSNLEPLRDWQKEFKI